MGGIIVIGGSKGGNGKTLLASLLAPGLAQRGYRTGVIDADPNAVFSAWHATYTGPALRCQAESRDVQVVADYLLSSYRRALKRLGAPATGQEAASA